MYGSVREMPNINFVILSGGRQIVTEITKLQQRHARSNGSSAARLLQIKLKARALAENAVFSALSQLVKLILRYASQLAMLDKMLILLVLLKRQAYKYNPNSRSVYRSLGLSRVR